MMSAWKDPRKPVKVLIGGVEHTLLLDDETAAKYSKPEPEVTEPEVTEPEVTEPKPRK